MTATAATATARAIVTTPTDREIRIERIFNAPRERVWRAMTDPVVVAQWWGRGNKLVIERDEVKRGGHWRYVEHAPSGAQGFEGRYHTTIERDGMLGSGMEGGLNESYVALDRVLAALGDD